MVFDDVSGLVNNPNAFSILLGVLWEGVASWNSTTEKLKIPKRFLFEGKIIIIANKLKGENADIVKSRCLIYNLEMFREDILKMMVEIAKQKHEELTEKERMMVVDYIKNNSNNSTIDLDLRTQKKIEQLYLFDKENWEELSKPLLNKDREIEILIKCLSESNNIREAQQRWCEEVGLHRATFYRYKKELKNV